MESAGPGCTPGPAAFTPALADASWLTARPVDPPGTHEVGGLVGFRRGRPGARAGRFSPDPLRDGSAASHLGGRALFIQRWTTSFLPWLHLATASAVWQDPQAGDMARSSR